MVVFIKITLEIEKVILKADYTHRHKLESLDQVRDLIGK